MIKVLFINDGESFGGVAKFSNDIKNNISKNIKIDILTSTNINNDWYNLDISRKSIIGKLIYDYRLNKFLKNNKYDIVHINSGVFLYALQVAIIAKKNGINMIVAHSHSIPYCSSLKKIIISLLRPLFNKIVDIKLSCSTLSAESLFGSSKDVRIINNGIVIDDYRFNEELRNKYRKEFDINDRIIYGNVSAFIKNKNHELLINVFKEILKRQDAILLLIGDGPTKSQIELMVNKLGISDHVLFLGERDDANRILNAMDVFIFPSLREGFGLVAIEAQTNGLITNCSNTIPKEVDISPFYNSFSVFDSIDVIADTIYCNKTNLDIRKNAYRYTIDKGFDINSVCDVLASIYNKD